MQLNEENDTVSLYMVRTKRVITCKLVFLVKSKL